MCSKTIPFLEKSSFDFTYLGNGETGTVILVPGIDVTPYYRVGLHIRIHSIQMTSTQTITFELDNSLPSADDPAEFIGTSLTTLVIDEADSAPSLVSTSTTGLGAGLRVQVTAQQLSAGGGTPLFVEMSGVLVLRAF